MSAKGIWGNVDPGRIQPSPPLFEKNGPSLAVAAKTIFGLFGSTATSVMLRSPTPSLANSQTPPFTDRQTPPPSRPAYSLHEGPSMLVTLSAGRPALRAAHVRPPSVLRNTPALVAAITTPGCEGNVNSLRTRAPGGPAWPNDVAARQKNTQILTNQSELYDVLFCTLLFSGEAMDIGAPKRPTRAAAMVEFGHSRLSQRYSLEIRRTARRRQFTLCSALTAQDLHHLDERTGDRKANFSPEYGNGTSKAAELLCCEEQNIVWPVDCFR